MNTCHSHQLCDESPTAGPGLFLLQASEHLVIIRVAGSINDRIEQILQASTIHIRP